ncbi:hypothetical protein AMTR_s00053p00018690 [Amborella trichopoda]|uniref:Uncharacterized protein n=1 Tax=Amborella trichopoda TaxID=13333 RepID=W1P527_AMBTC|nr:hypothetical protein AMTR_s00053p00018690 [Amborella trichopoda]
MRDGKEVGGTWSEEPVEVDRWRVTVAEGQQVTGARAAGCRESRPSTSSTVGWVPRGLTGAASATSRMAARRGASWILGWRDLRSCNALRRFREQTVIHPLLGGEGCGWVGGWTWQLEGGEAGRPGGVDAKVYSFNVQPKFRGDGLGVQ